MSRKAGTLLILAGMAVGAVSAAVGLQHTPPPPVSVQHDGGSFLPAYLQMLRGEKPWPESHCEATSLAELMIAPCDGH